MPIAQLTQPTAKPKAANGGLKTAENWSIEQNLRRVLGRPEDLTAYQDCIAGARAGWRDPLRLLVVALALLGCATRGYFPEAKSSDTIACRAYADQFGAVWVNLKFNECMEEAGYTNHNP